MRLSVAALCALALACGSGAKGVTPGGHQMDGGQDATVSPIPDAPPDLAAEVAALPDAGPEAALDAPPYVARDAGPPPVVITVAGECGSPSGPKCPATYLGTTAFGLRSTDAMTAALAPDDSLFLGGGFNVPTDFDPTAGVDMRMPKGGGDAFITVLGASGAYRSTDVFSPDELSSASVGNLSIGTNAIVALGGFGGTIDLDPGPNVDSHMGGRSDSFVVKMTAGRAYLWGRILTQTEGSLLSWSRAALAPDGGVYLTGSYAQSTQDGVVLEPVDLDPGPAVVHPPNATGSFLERLDPNGNLAWVRTFSGEGCGLAGVDGVVATADGSGWFVGIYQGTCALDKGGPTLPNATEGMFVLSFAPDGKVRSTGTVAASIQVAGVSLASDGTVVAGGAVNIPFANSPTMIDFDPSPTVLQRSVAASGNTFLMAIDATGKAAWAELLPAMSIATLAPTPDGGALLVSAPSAKSAGITVVRLAADRHEAWRFVTGSTSTYPTAILPTAKGFTLIGTVSPPGADLDPSAGVDRFTGTNVFLSRYAF